MLSTELLRAPVCIFVLKDNYDENRLTRSCLSVMLIFSTMDQNHRLNCSSLSAFSPVGWRMSLCLVYNSKTISEWTEADTGQRRSRQSNIPDSSLKEVKLMSIWTLTSPHPLTSSLKSSAVRSSRAFLGSTSSKPFLIAYERHRHNDWCEYTFWWLIKRLFVFQKNLAHYEIRLGGTLSMRVFTAD